MMIKELNKDMCHSYVVCTYLIPNSIVESHNIGGNQASADFHVKKFSTKLLPSLLFIYVLEVIQQGPTIHKRVDNVGKYMFLMIFFQIRKRVLLATEFNARCLLATHFNY